MTQKVAFELLKLGYNVYLTGEAGSGKTYLLNKYIDFLRKKHVEIGITASTGIAATHLNGRTIDSWSGLGIRDDISSDEIQELAQKNYLKKIIQTTRVLIIDEVSMLHGKRLDSIDAICKKIRNNTDPFGGLQVILCGDFFQLPPVSEERVHFDYVFKSNVWQQMNPHVLYLESQYRQTDPEFNQVLSAIRGNNMDEHSLHLLHTRMNKDIEGLPKTTKLYTHNIDVDAINSEELEKIPGEAYAYTMNSIGSEALVAAMKKSCLAPEELILKKGALVMFVRNNFREGYSNGTLGKIIGFDREGMPIVETYDKQKIHAQKTEWTIEEDGKIIAQLIQLPLRLAWAITIHKSQGMTLSAAEIDLSKSFVHGMGYVALSRVRSLKGIKLLGLNNLALTVNPEITEFDKTLRDRSNREVEDFAKMGFFKKFFTRRKFVYKLTS